LRIPKGIDEIRRKRKRYKLEKKDLAKMKSEDSLT